MNRLCVFFLLTNLLLYSSCSNNKRIRDEKVVFVSILPLKYFADHIVGGRYSVEVTVPPGAGPETYSPTPKQMKMLSEADAYFSIGFLSFEKAWLSKLSESGSGLKIFTASQGIELIKNEEEEHEGHDHAEGVDPHIWSSPKQAGIIARNIFVGISAIDPANKEYYLENMEKLVAEINQVDSTITNIFRTTSNKKFVIFHPALGYLARDYGLQQYSIEFEGKEPSPRHMQNLIKEAGDVKVVLVQKEFDKRNAEIVAQQIGAEISRIDPLDYNWPQQMISIAESIAKP